MINNNPGVTVLAFSTKTEERFWNVERQFLSFRSRLERNGQNASHWQQNGSGKVRMVKLVWCERGIRNITYSYSTTHLRRQKNINYTIPIYRWSLPYNPKYSTLKEILQPELYSLKVHTLTGSVNSVIVAVSRIN